MKNVFIVEDCKDLRDLYAITLAKEGYHIELFPDTEALTTSLNLGHCADLLVCDIRLPGMWGDQAIQNFRNLNRNPEARVLIVSGIDELAITTRCLGADSFLQKPVPMSKLREFISVELSYLH